MPIEGMAFGEQLEADSLPRNAQVVEDLVVFSRRGERGAALRGTAVEVAEKIEALREAVAGGVTPRVGEGSGAKGSAEADVRVLSI
eukprot:2081370-Lingulodinium_polyedra.AAC.1